MSSTAAELILDYASNLMVLCEHGVSGLTGSLPVFVEDESQRDAVMESLRDALPEAGLLRMKTSQELAGVSIPSGGAEVLLEDSLDRGNSQGPSKEFVLSAMATAELPAVLRLRVAATDASTLLWLRRVYHELCTWILVPRFVHARAQWTGMASRGWTPARVQALNSQMRVAERREALALAAKWFACKRTPGKVPHASEGADGIAGEAVSKDLDISAGDETPNVKML